MLSASRCLRVLVSCRLSGMHWRQVGAYIVEDVSENYIEKPFREYHCLSVRCLLNLSVLVQIAIFLLDLSIPCLCLAQSSSQIAPALSWVWLAHCKTVLDFRVSGLYKFKSEDVRKSTLCCLLQTTQVILARFSIAISNRFDENIVADHCVVCRGWQQFHGFCQECHWHCTVPHEACLSWGQHFTLSMHFAILSQSTLAWLMVMSG